MSGIYGVCLDLGHSTIPALLVPVCLETMESVLIWDTAPYLPCWYQYVWDLWGLSGSGTQHHTCPAGTSMSGIYGVHLNLAHSTIPALLVPVCLESLGSVWIWHIAPYLPCWYQYVWDLWSLSGSGTQRHTCPAGTSMSGIFGVRLYFILAHSTIPALPCSAVWNLLDRG